MATYSYSAITSGSQIAFDPDADTLAFDDIDISAAELTLVELAEGLQILVGGWSVTLLGVLSAHLTLTNIGFADGSILYVGDGSTGTAGDEGTNYYPGGQVSTGGNQVLGLGGNDVLYAYFATDVLRGGLGNDTLVGGVRAYGGGGRDSISGDSGGIFDGGVGNDTIQSGVEYIDTLAGGAGDDEYRVAFTAYWSGEDWITTGDVITELADRGLDTLLASNYLPSGYPAVVVELPAEVERLVLDVDMSGIGNAAANDITAGYLGSSIEGAAGNDTLNGLGGNDTLVGGSGEDAMSGGFGDDLYEADTSGDVVVEAEGLGTDTLRLLAAAYTLGDHIEIVVIDSVAGTALSAGAGSTLIIAGAGDDSIDAGAGIDTLSWETAGSGVTASLADDSASGGSGADTFNGIENLIGSAHADLLAGDAGDNLLDGRGGADTLAGGAGDDVLVIDAAGDIVNEAADAGHDTLRVTGAGLSVTLDANIEDADLRADSIALTANALDNRIRLGPGFTWPVTIDGGAGSDTLDASAAGGIGGFYLGASDYVQGVEHLVAGAYGGNWWGNELPNSILGGAGADALNGLGGNDTLAGGAGSDTYVDVEAGDLVIELDGEGDQDLVMSTGSFSLEGTGVERLRIEDDGSGVLVGTGNALDNYIFRGAEASASLIGGGGDDTLRASTIDTLIGGPGDDRYELESTDIFYGDVVEQPDEGIDTLVDFRGTEIPDNFEIVYLTDWLVPSIARVLGNELDNGIYGYGSGVLLGRAGNDTLVGGGTDALSGGGGDDSLSGSGGTDTLNGGHGNDTLAGGTQHDTLLGGKGNDLYLLEAGDVDDVVQEYAAEGIDTVQVAASYALPLNVEYLVLLDAAGAASGVGNAQANRIQGNADDNYLLGGAGNDSLYGGAGADWLEDEEGNDLFDGGPGADYMIGGDGNQTYVVDNAQDRVIEEAGGGTDTVRSSVTHTLAAHVEQLYLTGPGPIGGTGNGLANLIVGNAVANAIAGGNGDDELNGRVGRDTLTGGAGADRFVLDAPPADATRDTLSDFLPGTDRILLDDDVFPALGPVAGPTVLAAAALRIGTAAADADDRIVYDPATGSLYYDPDGTGATAQLRFAVLGTDAHPGTVAPDDFLVIG